MLCATRFSTVAALAGTLLLSCALAASKAPDLHAGQIDRIAERIRAEMVAQSIPGASVAIGRGDRVTFAQGFGIADLEAGIPVTTDTLFRTASIAKPITAAAVMQLVERGQIDLDADVRCYVPQFPEKEWPVTSRQLLGNQSGVRHYMRLGESEGKERYHNLLDTLEIFKNEPLRHEPGSAYTYTTYGFTLLGLVVESASGLSFDDYLHRHVFGPAQMPRTRVDDQYEIVPDRAKGYQRVSEAEHARLMPRQKERLAVGALRNATLHDTSMKIPGGGLISTPTELVRFGIAMQQGRVVSRETVARMWTAQPLKNGSATRYGYGWAVGRRGEQTLFSHSGGQAGASCYLYILPLEEVTISVMTNLSGAQLGQLMNDLTDIVVAGPAPR
jgi:CubicO group peptidase (beta-lactamase class C family)